MSLVFISRLLPLSLREKDFPYREGFSLFALVEKDLG